MIGIRADANETIAKGHIMRCIAIAQQLKKLGEPVVFLTADEFPSDILEIRGFPHICLNSNWSDKEGELNALLRYIKDLKIDKLLVDSYEVTYAYLERLKQHTKLIYIDDIYSFSYPVDALINYSISVEEAKYGYLKEDVVKLLGSQYIPLREEFVGEPVMINDKVSKVLITTGGSDNLFMTEHLLKRIAKGQAYENIEFHMVIGEYFINKEELIFLAKNMPNIILHQHVTNMADLMKLCDMAIAAGGTTLAELSYMGVPTISFAVADNQLRGIKAFEEKCMVPTVGDIRGRIEESIDKIFTWLDVLIGNKEKREAIARKQRQCIDGNGARRIAEMLKKL